MCVCVHVCVCVCVCVRVHVCVLHLVGDKECLGGYAGHQCSVLLADDVEVAGVVTVPLEVRPKERLIRLACRHCTQAIQQGLYAHHQYIADFS